MITRLVIVIGVMFAIGAGMNGFIHRAHRSDTHQCRNDWIKYCVFVAFVATVLTFTYVGRFGFGAFLVLIIATAAGELWGHVGKAPRTHLFKAGVLTLIIAAGLGHLLLTEIRHGFMVCAFAFLLVAVTDSYAQLIGRLAGKRRLCPRLSPNKTVAGLVGGIGAALFAAMICSFLLPGFGLVSILLLGALTGLAAVAGDLTFSAVKRRLGIKDFSRILPGHGGILDRVDSLILAAPVFFWTHYALGFLNGG